MEPDGRIQQLLEEIRDAQREHLAEYRRVTQQSLDLQQRAVDRQHELGMHLAFAVFLVFASLPGAAGGEPKPSPCRYEENCHCAAPGITLRWKAAYCMALEETDDLEHRGVQQCLQRPDPRRVKTLGTCEQNAHWKTMVCRVRHKREPDVLECVHDKAFVPRFVEHGPGS